MLEAEKLLRPIRAFTKGLDDLVPRVDLDALHDRERALTRMVPAADQAGAKMDAETSAAEAAGLRRRLEQLDAVRQDLTAQLSAARQEVANLQRDVAAKVSGAVHA